MDGRMDGWIYKNGGAPGCVVEKQTRRVSFHLKGVGGFSSYLKDMAQGAGVSARQTLCCWSTM